MSRDPHFEHFISNEWTDLEIWLFGMAFSDFRVVQISWTS